MFSTVMQCAESLPPPRNWDELLIYIMVGLIPVLFGHLKSRQNKNREEIEKLKTSVRLQQLDQDEKNRLDL